VNKRFHGVMVSTSDSESGDPGSIPGGTFFCSVAPISLPRRSLGFSPSAQHADLSFTRTPDRGAAELSVPAWRCRDAEWRSLLPGASDDTRHRLEERNHQQHRHQCVTSELVWRLNLEHSTLSNEICAPICVSSPKECETRNISTPSTSQNHKFPPTHSSLASYNREADGHRKSSTSPHQKSTPTQHRMNNTCPRMSSTSRLEQHSSPESGTS
jgi:hypothetical protein